MAIDVKEAVKIAKDYAAEVFAEENLALPTLEEVWFDDSSDEWCVTVGLKRQDAEAPLQIGTVFSRKQFLSEYKTVRISDADGLPKSIRNYDSAAA